MRQKVVHIVGPTGVGKTDLALSLAKKLDGSIISADSVQVYKGLDIISGKDIPLGSKFYSLKLKGKYDLGFYKLNIAKLYLVDAVEPTFSFSVFDFLKVSKTIIELVLKSRKLPIIVGGTGLYSQKIVSGLDNLESTDTKLRKKLELLSLEKLQVILKKLNKERYEKLNNSDVNNPRRLIRAIEIEKTKNKTTDKVSKENYDHLQIGLLAPREYLKEKIKKRIVSRLDNGALKEAEGLFQIYDELSPNVKNANGYKQLFSYLKEEISYEEAVYRWETSEYRHAKNQMTWFRKYGNVEWFDITKKGFKKEIEQGIYKFLS